MLMSIGISPELTQAAYRIGDSTTNIISPLMVYFPLVVVFCQKYVKGTGIGTLVALMVPYSVTFLVAWTLFLLRVRATRLPARAGRALCLPRRIDLSGRPRTSERAPRPPACPAHMI